MPREPVRAVHTEFIDLVCADPELLDAEFRELIATIAPPPPIRNAGPERPRRGRHVEARRTGHRPPSAGTPAASARERGPPRRITDQE